MKFQGKISSLVHKFKTLDKKGLLTEEVCKKFVENPSDLNGRYEGEIQHGKKNGRGTFYDSIDTYYEGEWVDEKKHGRGTQKSSDGSSYKGEFHEGKAHGCGTFKGSNGSSYKGEFHEGKAHGRGTFKGSNGSSYEGEWQADLRHGHGTQKWFDGSSYEGEWQANLRHGHGTHTWASGNLYQGEWQADLTHGHGTRTWANGDHYQGEFEKGEKHGHGTRTWANGDRYEGLWFRNWPGTYKENPHLFTFDLENDPKLINQFPSPKEMTRTAVIFQSTEDHNGAFKPFKEKCELLSKALESGKYGRCSIYYFSTPSQLKSQIEALAGKADLVWVRAHGEGRTFVCGPDGGIRSGRGNVDTLRPLYGKLSDKATIVLESCNLGKAGMLAEELGRLLGEKGLSPTIIASNGPSNFLGLDLGKLANEGTFDVVMVDSKGEKITKIYTRMNKKLSAT